MEIITVDKIEYIDGSILLKKAYNYYKGCRSSRDIVNKNNIAKENYIFAKKKNDMWLVADGKSVKTDHILIKIDYLKTVDGVKELFNENVEFVPGVYKITEDDIVLRGDNKNNIYILKTDVEEKLDIKIPDTMLLENDKYVKNHDYKYFLVPSNNKNRGVINKELFLTYEGMVRILFDKRTDTTNCFIEWASQLLFASQTGSDDLVKAENKIRGLETQVRNYELELTNIRKENEIFKMKMENEMLKLQLKSMNLAK